MYCVTLSYFQIPVIKPFPLHGDGVLMLVSSQDPCAVDPPPLFLSGCCSPQSLSSEPKTHSRIPTQQSSSVEFPVFEDLATELQRAVLQPLRLLSVSREEAVNEENGFGPFVSFRSVEIPLLNTDRTISSSFVSLIIKCWVH